MCEKGTCILQFSCRRKASIARRAVMYVVVNSRVARIVRWRYLLETVQHTREQHAQISSLNLHCLVWEDSNWDSSVYEIGCGFFGCLEQRPREMTVSASSIRIVQLCSSEGYRSTRKEKLEKGGLQNNKEGVKDRYKTHVRCLQL